MIWIIGDIHGCIDSLNKLLTEIEFYHHQSIKKNSPSHFNIEKIIFIGDYIDFGPSSLEVIEKIKSIPYPKILLIGNHEHTLYDYLYEKEIFKKYGPVWLNQQGIQPTIQSLLSISDYEGISPYEIKMRLKKQLEPFFQMLQYSHIEKIPYKNQMLNFLFIHGGINPQIDIHEQINIKNHDEYYKYLLKNNLFFDKSILWERAQLITKINDFLIVNGHTPHISLSRYYKHLFGWHEDFKIPFFSFNLNDETVNTTLYHEKEKNLYAIDRSILDITNINIDGGGVYNRCLLALGISQAGLENDIFYTISLDLNARFGFRNKKLLSLKEIIIKNN